MVLVHQKLIWLTALVAVFLAFYKVKSGYHLYRSRALNLMTVGLSLMIFGAMLGLAGSMGIFGPGYSKSIVLFAIESIIGYVGGWALLIWGMAIWLPYLFSVSSRLRKKSKSVNLYDSISRVSAYGDASPATFGKIGKAVMDNYGFQAASFHVMTRTKQLSLFASIGLNEKSNQLLAVVKNSLYNKVYDAGEVLLADENYRPHNDIIIETDSGPIVEALALPVDFGANRIGVMTVYTDHPRVFGQDELGILDSICGNLGLIFYKDGLQRSIKTQKAFRDFVAVILKTVRSEGDLHTRVIRLAKLLEQYVKFKTVSVYIWSNGSPQILDFNLPSGNNVFIEKGYLKGAKYEPIRWVLKNKRSLTLPDDARFLELDNQVQIDSRLLYMPVVVNGQAVGVISIAAIEPSYRFSQNDMIAADAIASVISGTILEEMNKTMADESFDRIGTIKYSIEAITDKDQSDQIYRELAKILVNKTPATFCRIMLLNEERDRFRTKAIYQRRELLWDERTITGLPVSELYSHRKVISMGKPLVISDVDSNLKISELEAKLLLPKGISQCMINPIIIDGKTIGVVTVGESRKPDRNQFGSQQIIFALLLTNVISVAFQQQDYDVRSKALVDSNRVTARRLVDFENQVDTLKIVGGFNSRINGPLAGILASCEYILSRQDIKREEMDRYINIINKNASKIHRLTNRLAEAKRAIETIVES